MKSLLLIPWAVAAAAVFAVSGDAPYQPSLDLKYQPGGRPQDTDMAINAPDVYAWELFMMLNRPARNAEGPWPDAASATDGLRYWESWKFANDVYRADGADPGEWGAKRVTAQGVSSLSRTFIPSKLAVIEAAQEGIEPSQVGKPPVREVKPPSRIHSSSLTLPPNTPGPPTKTLILSDILEQSVMNRASYDFIRGNKLYTLDGQEAACAANQKIEFPQAAMEVKSKWKYLGKWQTLNGSPTLKKYYWRAEMEPPAAETKIYGLVGFHITTKDIPNWFWCTFEHVNNPAPEIRDQPLTELMGHKDFVLRKDAPTDARFITGQSYIPAAARDTVWENYKLRGVQTSYVDSEGEPVLLANSVIETGVQGTSSCMSCHARATIGLAPPKGIARAGTGIVLPEDAHRLSIIRKSNFGAVGPVGTPDPSAYIDKDTGARKYLQLDFVWSMMRAHRAPKPVMTPFKG